MSLEGVDIEFFQIFLADNLVGADVSDPQGCGVVQRQFGLQTPGNETSRHDGLAQAHLISHEHSGLPFFI